MLSNCGAREDSWESLGHKIKPVNPKGNQPWIFIGRTDVGAEAPILWLPNVKSQLIGRDPDAAEDWRQEEKETTEDEIAGWHPWLNGHEFERTLGDGEEQGRLVCWSPWDHRVGYDWVTEQWHHKSHEKSKLFFIFNEKLFFWGGGAALGLGYCVQSFSSCSERGQLFCGTVASHAEHRLQRVQALVVVVRGL